MTRFSPRLALCATLLLLSAACGTTTVTPGEVQDILGGTDLGDLTDIGDLGNLADLGDLGALPDLVGLDIPGELPLVDVPVDVQADGDIAPELPNVDVVDIAGDDADGVGPEDSGDASAGSDAEGLDAGDSGLAEDATASADVEDDGQGDDGQAGDVQGDVGTDAAVALCLADTECAGLDSPCGVGKCDGALGCVVVLADDDTPCDDKLACTTLTTCQKGECVGTVTNCEDGNSCTADSCDPDAGCVHEDLTGVDCDDGNACTVGDGCSGGKCLPSDTQVCDDGQVCTTDACDPTTGCTVEPADGGPCSDNSVCTQVDVCAGGKCLGTDFKDCSDGDPCTDDGCKAGVGCVNLPNTATCSDNDACTIGEACDNKACVGGVKDLCNDNTPCTQDSCDKDTGCQHTNAIGPCNDDNACTKNETCAGGVCGGGLTLGCDDSRECSVDSCDAIAACQHDMAACCESAGECNDGNPCTDDTCSFSLGCVHKPNIAACDDGDKCTVGETCSATKCVGGQPANCVDSEVCTTDGCDPDIGCTHKANAFTCTDDDACTTGDVCDGGTCKSGTPTPIDDARACSLDSCDKAVGPQHDLTPCCANEAACNDGNPCTDDLCDFQTGCSHTANSAACSDNDACTENDTCADKACVSGQPKVCVDSNQCTDNLCAKATGCLFPNLPDDTTCTDDSVCTLVDACVKGECKPGAAKNCDDSKLCTQDSCNPSTGCVNADFVGVCNDGDACTAGEVCDVAGLCASDTPTDCNDANDCTNDSCDAKAGCVHLANTASCTDGDACTVEACAGKSCTVSVPSICVDGDACTDDKCDHTTGACSYPTTNCDDSSACTTDSCDPTGGCKHAAVVCVDGLACTTDSCDAATGCKYVDKAEHATCGTDEWCVSKVCTAIPTMDVSGWKIVQANATQSFTLPTGTILKPGGYVIMARNVSKATFETFWKVTLSDKVIFINSANSGMAVNGDETYKLTKGDNSTVDGPTIAMGASAGSSIQRTSPAGAPGTAGSWTVKSSNTVSNATPGSGQTTGVVNKVYISEFSDASTFDDEFVELFYDPGP